MIFLQILISVILPIFIMIALGVLIDRRFELDLNTMTKLNFYVFVPALSFVKLLDADVTLRQMGAISLFGTLQVVVLLVLSWLVYSTGSLYKHRTPLTMGTLFYNCGNYGIPLVAIAFGSRQIGTITAIIIIQTLLSFTLGIWIFGLKAQGVAKAALGLAKVPVVQAMAAALIFRGFHIPVPAPIYRPLAFLSDGLIPLALLTLGMQLSRTRLTRGVRSLSAVTVMRLVISPIVAVFLVKLFGFSGTLASVLIVAAGFPVAVNVYVLAAEYGQDEDLVSQSIFVSTILSAVTVSVLLAIYR